jgi:hypothetical protein
LNIVLHFSFVGLVLLGEKRCITNNMTLSRGAYIILLGIIQQKYRVLFKLHLKVGVGVNKESIVNAPRMTDHG